MYNNSFNSSNKKSIKDFFTTRNMLIMLGIVIVVGLVLYFLLGGSSKTKTMTCTFSYDYGFAESNTELDITYKEEAIEKVIVDSEYDIEDQIIRDQMDLYEQKLREAFSKVMSDKCNFKLIRDNYKIIITYEVDFNIFDSNDIKASEYLGLPSQDELGDMTLSDLKNQVEKNNGVCK